MKYYAVLREISVKKQCTAMVWNANGSKLAVAGSDYMRVWCFDSKFNLINDVINLGGEKISDLHWHPTNPDLLASGSGGNDKFIKVWDTRSGKVLNSLQLSANVLYLNWSPNGNHVIVKNVNDEMIVINRFPQEAIAATAASVDNSTDQPITQTTASSFSFSISNQLQTKRGEGIYFTKNCRAILQTVGSNIDIVCFPSLEKITSINILPTYISVFAVDPFENFLAVCGSEHFCSVWDFKTFTHIASTDMLPSHPTKVSFSFDGQYLAYSVVPDNSIFSNLSSDTVQSSSSTTMATTAITTTTTTTTTTTATSSTPQLASAMGTTTAITTTDSNVQSKQSFVDIIESQTAKLIIRISLSSKKEISTISWHPTTYVLTVYYGDEGFTLYELK